jgi:alpha-glucosidase (family GH31 glycosyl hydrolase)
MRRWVWIAGLLATGQAARPASRADNLYSFRLSDGWGQVEWMSQSAFRLTRAWGARPARRPPVATDPVKVSRKDLSDRWQFTTKYLVAEFKRADFSFRITGGDGKLLTETAAVRKGPGGVELEFAVEKAERFCGLGVRTAASLDLRGQLIKAGKPFLMSSLGYGEYYGGGKEYVFDLGQERAERRRVAVQGTDEVEYYFYYGPSPKEIFEEHAKLGAPGAKLYAADFGLLEEGKIPRHVVRLPGGAGGSWSGLQESIHALLHAGFSAVLASAFDVGPYAGAEGELRERAGQLASVVPVVLTSSGGRQAAPWANLLATRKRLTPYLVCYAQEARENGYPMVRPLAVQFPTEPETWKVADQFMLGDELMVAPVCAPGGRRSVYFPRGVWTDLRNNRVYKSRQTAQIEAAPNELPLFGRNGTIVPFDGTASGDPMVLHYFPKLAAEFFILEEDLSDFTLLHAAPAVETVRLETESLKDREYEWVVHHTGPCKRVAQVDGGEYREGKSHGELKPGWWYYDRKLDNLHVRIRARAGQDHIVNLWLEAVWN